MSIITVDVKDLSIIVKGRTGPRAKVLGYGGLGFKWDRDRNRWRGRLTLFNLRILSKWPEVMLSNEARQAIEEFEQAQAKREAHMAIA